MIKFKLRKFRRNDEESLRKNINDIDINRNTLDIPYPYTKKDAKFWIKRNLKLNKAKKQEEINLVIDINNEVVGSIGLNHISKEHDCAEVGYWLAKKYWGYGIMTKAVEEIIKFAFNKLKLNRVYARVFTFNKASAKVLEKSGFKLEGHLIKNVKKEGKYYDSFVYGLVK